MPVRRTSVALSCFVVALLVTVTHAGVEVERSATGLRALRYAGADLLADGDIRLIALAQHDDAGQLAPVDRKLWSGVKPAWHSDTLQWTYPWGTLACTVTATDDRLTFAFAVHNQSNRPLDGVGLELPSLRLTGTPQWGTNAHSRTGPPLAPVTCAEATMVLCVDEDGGGAVGLSVAFDPRRGAQLRVLAGGAKQPADELDARRPIPPGTTDRFIVSLRFAPPGTPLEDLAGDVARRYGEAMPMRLRWPDRRPILRTFLGGGLPKEQADANLQNPDAVQPPAAAGPAVTRVIEQKTAGVLAAAQACDAQGVIVWDLEGNTYPHAVTYIGDPRLMRLLNPEVDLLADRMFAAWHEAGLLAGVTLRPSRVVWNEEKKKASHSHTVAGDPFTELDGKIRYARQRWGCRLFYIDTSVFWRPPPPGAVDEDGKPAPWTNNVIHHDVWRRLLEAHPDVLLIPEVAYPACHAFTAPYTEADMNGWGVRAAARMAWPDAFMIVVIEDEDPYPTASYARFVESVRAGNVLMTFGSGAASRNVRAAARIRTEAGWLDDGPPDSLPQDADELAALVKNGDERTRYFAAAALADRGGTVASAALLDAALDEAQPWLVRRRALVALADQPPGADVAAAIVNLMAKDDTLVPAAADVLVKLGPAATSALLAALPTSTLRSGVRLADLCDALRRLGDPAALPALRDRLESDADLTRDRRAADLLLKTIGAIGGEAEKPYLLAVAQRTPVLRTGVAVALIPVLPDDEARAFIEGAFDAEPNKHGPAGAALRAALQKHPKPKP